MATPDDKKPSTEQRPGKEPAKAPGKGTTDSGKDPAASPARRPAAPVVRAPIDVSMTPGTDGAEQSSLGELSPDNMPAPQFVQQLEAGLADPTKEIGGTGLKGAEPYGGFLWEDYLPQLRGWQAARIYREMADSDPMCGAVLYALEMLMRSVNWRVEPVDQRPESIVAAERMEAGLFQDMSHTFGQLIDEATSMLTYGYAPHEIIWKRCAGETDDPETSSQFSDGMLMPASIPIRAQDTIWRWIFDNDGHGRVIGLEQWRMGVANVVIPIQKLLLFRTVSRKNNPEGRSILRNAYKTYLRKDVIEQSEGRLAVRSAGIVDMRIPSKFMEAAAGSDEAKIYTMYKAIADKLAQDRSGSVVLPSDKDDKGNALYDMKYLVADARQVGDMSPIVDRMDTRIAMSVLADFLMLGTKSVGSFALGQSKITLFGTACEGFLASIEEIVNRVLLGKIWKLNALDPTTRPKVKAGSVQEVDLQQLGDFLSKLSGAGAVIFPSVDGRLEGHLLSLAKLPTQTEQG
jgi:hypothetical protein